MCSSIQRKPEAHTSGTAIEIASTVRPTFRKRETFVVHSRTIATGQPHAMPNTGRPNAGHTRKYRPGA